MSFDRDQDTICAVCTASGHGAIAIIRVSGAQALAVVRHLAHFLPAALESHRIYYGVLRDPGSREDLDEVLVSYFASGRSFTGEETLEISCHGGALIVQRVLKALLGAGARMAQNGEFTYRAFMGGRIDLVQAEAVLAVIESQTEFGARQALRQLQGGLSQRLVALEHDLTWVLSRLEANLDFSAEFIEFAAENEIVSRAEQSLAEARALIASYRQGRLIKDGLRVALVGAPNVGKSSLLNALAAQDRAIVSPIAGTTRDTIEVEINVDGQKVTLVDTAGLRETADAIELLGVERTKLALADADLILFIFDGSNDASATPGEFLPKDKPAYRVANKCDLVASSTSLAADVAVSAHTGEGLDKLRAHLREVAFAGYQENMAVVQSARHFEQLQRAETHLVASIRLLREKASPEFVISEAQEALMAVFDILGKRFDDEVLDRVFKDFCLGK